MRREHKFFGFLSLFVAGVLAAAGFGLSSIAQSAEAYALKVNPFEVVAGKGGAPATILLKTLEPSAIKGAVKLGEATSRSDRAGLTIESEAFQVVWGLKQPSTINVSATNEAGLRAAITAAKASSGPDTVYLPSYGSSGLTITAPIPIFSTIRYQGVAATFSHSSSVPDNDITFTGGTWIKGDGTFPGFQAQTIDGTALDVSKGSPDANFSTTGIRQAGVSDVGIQNCSIGISGGAHNQMGFLFKGSRFSNIQINGCASWGINFVNFQHIVVEDVWTFGCGNGQRYAADVASAVLQPGNSTITRVFDNPGNGLTAIQLRNHRGIVFEATDGSNLNEISAPGRIQANFFSKSRTSYTTATGGSGSFTLQAGKGLEWSVSMPLRFSHAGGNSNITVGQTYFIKTVSTDTISVSATRNGAAITGSYSTSTAITSCGFGNMEIIGGASGFVTNSTFLNLDLEGPADNALSLENAFGNFILINELHASAIPHITVRASQPNQIVSMPATVVDIDGSSVDTTISGGAITHVSGSSYAKGVYKNDIGNWVLGLSPFDPAITWKASSGGGFLLPGMPLGVNSEPWPYADANLNANAGGTIYPYGQAATSIRLTPIVTASDQTNTIGANVNIYNGNTGILTVSQNGTSDLINGFSGKTTYALPAKTATSLAWSYSELQTINGVNQYVTKHGVSYYQAATQTQLSNKSTGVTSNAISGRITMNSASLGAATGVTFTLTNNQIASADNVNVNIVSGNTANSYGVWVSGVTTGSCQITLYNFSGGALGEAVILNFLVNKALG